MRVTGHWSCPSASIYSGRGELIIILVKLLIIKMTNRKLVLNCMIVLLCARLLLNTVLMFTSLPKTTILPAGLRR